MPLKPAKASFCTRSRWQIPVDKQPVLAAGRDRFTPHPDLRRELMRQRGISLTPLTTTRRISKRKGIERCMIL